MAYQIFDANSFSEVSQLVVIVLKKKMNVSQTLLLQRTKFCVILLPLQSPCVGAVLELLPPYIFFFFVTIVGCTSKEIKQMH